jgi:hypothetical protein
MIVTTMIAMTMAAIDGYMYYPSTNETNQSRKKKKTKFETCIKSHASI